MSPKTRLWLIRSMIIAFGLLAAFMIVGNIVSTKYELAHPELRKSRK
jgi:hypothetical protein